MIGRTSADKSSLISTHFRLFNEGLESEIKIDGTSTVDLSELQCAAKSPLYHRNLCSFLRVYITIWIRLISMMTWSCERCCGKSSWMMSRWTFSGGHNFSVSQRQFICLARAILRNACSFSMKPRLLLIRSKSLRFFRLYLNIIWWRQ